MDRVLSDIPRHYAIGWIVLLGALLVRVEYLTGPWVPFGIFYLLCLYLAVRYIGGNFPYGLAFAIASAKTYIKIQNYPQDAFWWQGQWQFLNSCSIYLLFCYLINAQIGMRRRAEEALGELSRLNQAIVAEIDAGVLFFHGNGRCVIANEGAARILGMLPERLRQIDFSKNDAWGIPLLRDAVYGTMVDHSPRKFTVCLRGDNGQEVWVVVSIGPLLHAGVTYVLAVLTDISTYRQARETAALALNRAGVAERKLINIIEETQQRIGRELHDDLGQHLTGAAFLSEVLFQGLKSERNGMVQDAAKLTTLMNEAIAKTRHLAQGLFPAELREHGLGRMMEKFAGHVEVMYRVRCDFLLQGTDRMDDMDQAIHLFRITQEAVNNAIRHGHAAHLWLRLMFTHDACVLEIDDDGCGIAAGAEAVGEGLGMRTMQYRADLLGAELVVAAQTAGGTRVAVTLPMAR